MRTAFDARDTDDTPRAWAIARSWSLSLFSSADFSRASAAIVLPAFIWPRASKRSLADNLNPASAGESPGTRAR